MGKILCGIQVPEKENEQFDQWLMNLGYPFVEETQNPAYADFLGDDDDDDTTGDEE